MLCRGAVEASHGYVLVNALPGQVMPKPSSEKPAEAAQGVPTSPQGQQQQQQQQQQQPGALLG